MKRILIFLLMPLVLSAGVPSNSVLITAQGGAQNGRPITISRIFAKGEIAGYAKPSIRGVGVPSIWQNDVKTRWRDGKTSCAITGATNVSPIVVTCASHGFQEGEQVSVSGVSGNTAANGKWTVQTVSANTFELLNSHGNGTYSSGGTAIGPAPGSLKHVLVSFRADLPANPGSVTVDFSDDPNPCSSGDQTACNAASLDASGMLAFNSGTWTATTQTSASNVVHFASARTMLTAGKFRYWLRGPAVTQVIAGDEDRTYDWGYDCQGGGCYTTWTDDTVNRSLHPLFVLTFHTGWSGVKVEYIAENIWNNQLREMHYDLTLTNSSGTVFSYSGLTHYGQTRWRRVYWDGSEPGGAGQEKLSVKVDLGSAYLVYSGVIPPYDLALDSSGAAAGYYSWFTANQTSAIKGVACPGNGSCGTITQDMPQTGGRDDIGLLPNWDAVYLLTMDPRMRTVSEGNADVAGLIPVHARMLDSGGQYPYYDAAGTVAKYWHYVGAQSQKDAGTSGVGAMTDNHGWTFDYGHLPAVCYAAYITGGEWYHLTNLYGVAHALTTQANFVSHGQDYPNPYITLGINGIVIYDNIGRYHIWPVRTVGMAAFAAPDGTAEKNYLTGILLQNAAYIEGAFGVRGPLYSGRTTTGNYNNQYERSAWFQGRFAVGAGTPNPLGFGTPPSSTGGTALFDAMLIPSSDYAFSAWGHAFMTVGYGFLSRLFPFVSGAAEGTSRFIISSLGSGRPPAYTGIYYSAGFTATDLPVLTQAYSGGDTLHVSGIPAWISFPSLGSLGGEVVYLASGDRAANTITIAGHRLFYSNTGSANIGDKIWLRRPIQDWAEWDATRDIAGNSATWNAWAASTHLIDWASTDGYGRYALGAAAFSYPWTANGWLGRKTWDIARADALDAGGGGGLANFNTSPKFFFKPNFDPARVTATPGDTFVVLEYIKPRADEACKVDGVSDGVTNSRLVRFVKSGLAANSSGTLTVACPSDPYGSTAVPFTTLPGLLGMGSYTWTAAGGDTSLSYGGTSSLGSSTSASDCSSGCTISLPKGLQYVQLNRGGAAAGEIRPVVIDQ